MSATATVQAPRLLPTPAAPDRLAPRSPAQRALERRFYRLTLADHLLSRRPSASGPRLAERERVHQQLWEDAPFEVQPARPVPELAEPDFDAFIGLSDNYRRPVVVRGMGAQTAAVQTWSPEHLASRLGDAVCTVVEMDELAMEKAHSSGRVLLEMPFSEFVARMEDEPLYLHNSTQFVQDCPELLDDVELHRIREVFTTPGSSWDEIWASNLFVGGEKVFSNLHHAPGGNFFQQILGVKHWTLVDPELTPYLMPMLARPFNHSLSAYGNFDKHEGTDSPIFRLPRYTVSLEPGDMLYNPPWWWHEVRNTGSTIGCALRHLPPPLAASPTWRNHPLFSAFSLYPKLWAFSAMNYAKHRAVGSRATMRAALNPRFSKSLNKARER